MSSLYRPVLPPDITGLKNAEVAAARRANGANVGFTGQETGGWRLVVDVVTEPMFILLAVASLLYWVLNQWQEGLVLGIAMGLVAGISLFQNLRSNRALQTLAHQYSPTISVLRDGQLTAVAREELVVGDVVWLQEGQTVPADGVLLQANDCTVDEAVMTGESVPAAKMVVSVDRFWAGTLMASGSAYMHVTSVGTQTELGKLGRSLYTIESEKTPLQRQMARFVKQMALIGMGAFLLIWGINFHQSGDWVGSLLTGLTLAMSVLPEEIPVAFSSFMALGAARLVRLGVLTRQPQAVESLGSATVICTDKTGTLTEEGMILAHLYDGTNHQLISRDATVVSGSAREVLAYARWASEPQPFDPMEKAIQEAAGWQGIKLTHTLVQEYPLEGVPPMMTHVYGSGPIRVAAKGAVERIVRVCHLPQPQAHAVMQVATDLAQQGYRVLGIAGSDWPDIPYPTSQDDFPWSFKGLIALENPPKANARSVVTQFRQAGITVKMITGDAPETATTIARQVGIDSSHTVMTGSEVMALPDATLQGQVRKVNVFARMFPDAKLRVIQALKATGEVVAMTGDGVNDGPALKAAHIGVAMGRRGTEVAKQAATLILVHDDLSGMVAAIAQGRRIYQNLKRAVGYIISIHIPILLTVTVPLVVGWSYVNLFNPVHVIFLELVMGPTCSIAFENEPAEKDLMLQRPRPITETFFSARELGGSILQGLSIALAVLGIYYYTMQSGAPIEGVRTQTFTTLVLSNCWLTLVSRSKWASFGSTLRRPNSLLWLLLGITLLMLTLTLWVPALRRLAMFTTLPLTGWVTCLVVSLLGVSGFEVYKYLRSRRAG